VVEGGVTEHTIHTLASHCGESGFEMIEMGGGERERREGEEEGEGRVWEAMEAHMWRDMKRKPHTHQYIAHTSHTCHEDERHDEQQINESGGLPSKSAEVSHDLEESEGDVIVSSTDPVVSFSALLSEISSSHNPSSLSSSSSSSSSSASSFSSSSSSASSSSSSSSPAPSSSNPFPSLSIFDLLGDDQEGGDEEALLSAIRQFRELKDVASSLPDEERREMAARVALGFAALLCGDDDEED
jgi:hypothetical protein